MSTWMLVGQPGDFAKWFESEELMGMTFEFITIRYEQSYIRVFVQSCVASREDSFIRVYIDVCATAVAFRY